MSDLTLKSSDMSKQKVVIEHVEAKWTKRGKQLCMQKQAQIMQKFWGHPTKYTVTPVTYMSSIDNFLEVNVKSSMTDK
jgi:hypothetical protein